MSPGIGSDSRTGGQPLPLNRGPPRLSTRALQGELTSLEGWFIDRIQEKRKREEGKKDPRLRKRGQDLEVQRSSGTHKLSPHCVAGLASCTGPTLARRRAVRSSHSPCSEFPSPSPQPSDRLTSKGVRSWKGAWCLPPMRGSVIWLKCWWAPPGHAAWGGLWLASSQAPDRERAR